jgi:hypothetical protein
MNFSIKKLLTRSRIERHVFYEGSGTTEAFPGPNMVDFYRKNWMI